MKHWTICAAADTKNPNRVPFRGVLTLVDMASDKAPRGARGRRTILTKAAAENSLHTLIGMAIDYKDSWDGHNERQKVGVITAARIKGNKVLVKGHLYGKDFKDVVTILEKMPGKIGMSYELHDAHIADMRATVWEINKATFTGAAIMYKDKAAYRSTSFEVSRNGFKKEGSSVDTGLVSAPVAACA